MGSLARHMKSHDPTLDIHCGIDGCTFSTSTTCRLARHVTTHNPLKKFACAYEHCSYRTSQSGHLQRHVKSHTGETSFECEDAHCDRRFINRYDRTSHFRSMHGPNAGKLRKRDERNVELALLCGGYTESNFGGDWLPVPGQFKREFLVDFACVEQPRGSGEHRARIDFIISLPQGGTVFLEVDEHQHKYGYNSLVSCDMRRIARIEESRFMEEAKCNIPPQNVVWVRYNPHTFRVHGKLVSLCNRRKREQWLIEYLNTLDVALECRNSRMALRYAFYDRMAHHSTLPKCVMHSEFHQEFASVSSVIGVCCEENAHV
jgi:hypothetical protein